MIIEVFAREAVTERPFSVELAAEHRMAERGLETVLVQRHVILAFAADEQIVSHSAVDALQRLIDGERRTPGQAFGGVRAGAVIGVADKPLFVQVMDVVDAELYNKT